MKVYLQLWQIHPEYCVPIFAIVATTWRRHLQGLGETRFLSLGGLGGYVTSAFCRKAQRSTGKHRVKHKLKEQELSVKCGCSESCIAPHIGSLILHCLVLVGCHWGYDNDAHSLDLTIVDFHHIYIFVLPLLFCCNLGFYSSFSLF